MKFRHIILASTVPLLSLRRFVLRAQGRGQPGLRVLLYHDVPGAELARLKYHLEQLSRQWRFLTPAEFEQITRGEKALDQDSLLMTFDDGFVSNRPVADEVLAPLGIKAIFFLVPEFLSIENRLDARAFIAKNIYPDLSESSLPAHWYNMNWSDAAALVQAGHSIGCHTLRHARLSAIRDEKQLREEICTSADRLAERLGVAVDHFAYTFGNLESFSAEALAIAASRFRFVYSGLRGANHPDTSCLAIRRESVFSSDPLLLTKAYLLGAADFPYQKSVRTLDAWAKGIEASSYTQVI